MSQTDTTQIPLANIAQFILNSPPVHKKQIHRRSHSKRKKTMTPLPKPLKSPSEPLQHFTTPTLAEFNLDYTDEKGIEMEFAALEIPPKNKSFPLTLHYPKTYEFFPSPTLDKATTQKLMTQSG